MFSSLDLRRRKRLWAFVSYKASWLRAYFCTPMKWLLVYVRHLSTWENILPLALHHLLQPQPQMTVVSPQGVEVYASLWPKKYLGTSESQVKLPICHSNVFLFFSAKHLFCDFQAGSYFKMMWYFHYIFSYGHRIMLYRPLHFTVTLGLRTIRGNPNMQCCKTSTSYCVRHTQRVRWVGVKTLLASTQL